MEYHTLIIFGGLALSIMMNVVLWYSGGKSESELADARETIQELMMTIEDAAEERALQRLMDAHRVVDEIFGHSPEVIKETAFEKVFDALGKGMDE